MAIVYGGSTSERFGLIHRYKDAFGVSGLCNWLGVSITPGAIEPPPRVQQKKIVELIKSGALDHQESSSVLETKEHEIIAETCEMDIA